MHFKEFKSVKNAFYSSAVVTRASQNTGVSVFFFCLGPSL